MQLRRSVVVASVAAAVAAVVVIVAWGRSAPGPSDRNRERARLAADLVEKGQREFKTIPMASLAGFHSLDEVRSTLDRMEFASEPGATTGGRGALLDQVAAFVYYRFVTRSVEDYMRWRRASGMELIPMEELRRLWLVERRHQEQFGGPIPDGMTEEELFVRFWDAAPEFRDGKKWPVAISSESKGLLAICSPYDNDGPLPSERPALSGQMPREVWYGGIAGGLPPWWRMVGASGGRQTPRLLRTE